MIVSCRFQCYGSLSEGEMQDIRYDILNFFLDYRVKVSIFLKEKRQSPSGTFVIDVTGPLPAGEMSSDPSGHRPLRVAHFAPQADTSASCCQMYCSWLIAPQDKRLLQLQPSFYGIVF